MANIRWRLVVGLVSLGATLILTLPTVAAARPLSSRHPALSPGGAAVADVIWPNGAALNDIIWPNPTVTGDTAGANASP